MFRIISHTWLCLYLCLSTFSINCSNSPAQEFSALRENKTVSGKVIKISDGDTFHMLLQNKQSIKVRLYGIDCPEQTQPYFQQAKNTLAELIFSRNISL